MNTRLAPAARALSALALSGLTLLLMAAGPAPTAPDRPPTAPTRDAVIGYHLRPATGEPIDVRVGVRAGGRAMRLDLPDQTYMIIMPGTRVLTLVVPEERTLVDMPWDDGPQGLFLLDDRMRFTRKTEATVAGTRCMQYETQLDKAHSTVCVTADGVVLRSQTQDPLGRRNLIEAFVVRYQGLPEGDFVLPSDFDRLVPTLRESGK